jgi:hypothetical protein
MYISFSDPSYETSRGYENDFTAHAYHASGLIGTALSKKMSVFQPSALKVAPMSPNAC